MMAFPHTHGKQVALRCRLTCTVRRKHTKQHAGFVLRAWVGFRNFSLSPRTTFCATASSSRNHIHLFEHSALHVIKTQSARMRKTSFIWANKKVNARGSGLERRPSQSACRPRRDSHNNPYACEKLEGGHMTHTHPAKCPY
jgi:hypothetical protein